MEAPHPFSYSTGDLYRDSSHTNTTYTTDFSASTGKPKPVAGADFYDRSYFSRRVALFGLFISFLVGIACIVCSVHVFLSKRTMLTGVAFLPLEQWWQRELVGLGATLLVALCTEATGFVHNVALRSALASEQRLRFNTNLRLLSAAKGALNPNGKMFNGLMALLLVVSYSSGILVTLAVVTDSSEGRTRAVPLPSTTQIYISNVALLVLGGALLLQVVIAVVAMATADIRTWSSSPFDITAALVHHTQVTPVQGRCMHGVKDVDIHVPLLPRKKQPSAWRSHSSLRKVVITIWVLVFACIAWAFVVTHISAGNVRNVFTSWSFFSGQQSYVAAYPISLLGKTAWVDWVVCFLSTMAVQGWVTLTLHCSELVANVIRDEKVWRCATEMKGAKVLTHPLAPVLGSWLSLTLLCAKALLRGYFLFVINSVRFSWMGCAVDVNLPGPLA